jgi:hypothetical protein
MSKVHLVTLSNIDTGAIERKFLVRAHTKVGAEKYVQRKVAGFIDAKVPTQDELIGAMQAGVRLEDATLPEDEQLPLTGVPDAPNPISQHDEE